MRDRSSPSYARVRAPSLDGVDPGSTARAGGRRIAAVLCAAALAVIGAVGAVQADESPPRAIVFPLIAPRLSSHFGLRVHPIRKFSSKHQGVDLAAPENSHVRAILDGRVVFAGPYAGYGNLVTIDHGHGFASLYGHLGEITVQVGTKIPAGTLIGRVGSSGLATGPHLHFEWRKDGKALDPLKVFPSLAEVSDG